MRNQWRQPLKQTHLFKNCPGRCVSFWFAMPQPNPAPRFRLRPSRDVNLIVLNVSVSDRGGQPVHGLRREDFQVYEDGKLRMSPV
jgi:hypothetical protein